MTEIHVERRKRMPRWPIAIVVLLLPLAWYWFVGRHREDAPGRPPDSTAVAPVQP